MDSRPGEATGAIATAGIARLREAFLQAQLAGDRREALRLILEDGIVAGHRAADLLLGVIQPAQYEIGRRWQNDEISVAQEHLATAISQLAVSHLYRHLECDRPNGRLIVVACADGELHELGARIAADFLEMAGFTVHFLGANVPARSLASMIHKRRPDALVLSAATSLCFPGLRTSLEAVREAAGEGMPILVGGSAFSWSEECAIPANVVYAGRDARELVEVVRDALRMKKAA